MLLHQFEDNLEGVSQVGVNVDSLTFNLMIDGIYENKLHSTIRELATNARDSVKEAGKGEITIAINKNTLTIKDTGLGLSREEAEQYLCNLNSSSKRSNDTAVGCLGIGSKAPFSLVDTYSYICVKDGVKTHLDLFRVNKAPPRYVIHSTPTEEEDSVSVSIHLPEVPQRDLLVAAVAETFLFDVPVSVYADGELQDIYPKVIDLDEVCLVTYAGSPNGLRSRVMEYISTYKNVASGVVGYRYTPFHVGAYSRCAIIKTELGEVGFTSSREAIENTPENMAVIEGTLQKFINKNKHYLQLLDTYSSDPYGGFMENVSLLMQFLDSTIHNLRNLHVWLAYSYLCMEKKQQYNAGSPSLFLSLYAFLELDTGFYNPRPPVALPLYLEYIHMIGYLRGYTNIRRNSLESSPRAILITNERIQQHSSVVYRYVKGTALKDTEYVNAIRNLHKYMQGLGVDIPLYFSTKEMPEALREIVKPETVQRGPQGNKLTFKYWHIKEEKVLQGTASQILKKFPKDYWNTIYIVKKDLVSDEKDIPAFLGASTEMYVFECQQEDTQFTSSILYKVKNSLCSLRAPSEITEKTKDALTYAYLGTLMIQHINENYEYHEAPFIPVRVPANYYCDSYLGSLFTDYTSGLPRTLFTPYLITKVLGEEGFKEVERRALSLMPVYDVEQITNYIASFEPQ